MKAYPSKHLTKVFQPVTVNILLESQKELDLMTDMLGYDIRIPELMALSREDQYILSDMMQVMQAAIYQAIKEQS